MWKFVTLSKHNTTVSVISSTMHQSVKVQWERERERSLFYKQTVLFSSLIVVLWNVIYTATVNTSDSTFGVTSLKWFSSWVEIKLSVIIKWISTLNKKNMINATKFFKSGHIMNTLFHDSHWWGLLAYGVCIGLQFWMLLSRCDVDDGCLLVLHLL